MVDHLRPDNGLVELAIGTDHITEPKKVFIDKFGKEGKCRVDTTVKNREDSIGHGIFQSGAYSDPRTESICSKVAGMTITSSRLCGHMSKDLTIWLNPDVLVGTNWVAPFELATHGDDDLGLQEGEEFEALDRAPTAVLHEMAHTVAVESGFWDMEMIIDECLSPQDLPLDATAEDCNTEEADFDPTVPTKVYELYLCQQLARGYRPLKTLTNAENYCLFALLVFLYDHLWDLSSGVAKRVDFETTRKLRKAWG